jgi:large subunit ribosomal protein L17
MYRGLVSSLLTQERIITTEARARGIRPQAEKLITLGKRENLQARRLAVKRIGHKKAVRKLWDEISPRYAQRKGGYTRIVKLGSRHGDGAPMAIIELVK